MFAIQMGCSGAYFTERGRNGTFWLMKNRLDGGKAFITGIDSAIGGAIAKELKQAGMKIAGTHLPDVQADRSPRVLLHTDFLLSMDQTDVDSINDAVRVARKRLGGLNVFVAVGSRQSPESFLETFPMEIARQIDVNLKGNLLLVRAAAQAMIECRTEKPNEHYSIGLMGSIRGRHSLKFDAYEASKAGLHHMVAGLAAEFGEHGISINAVAPGTVDCPIEWQRYGSEVDYRRVWSGATPLKRSDGSLATPEDVAETMAFLLNSGRITGETVVVDGGFNRKHPLPLDQHTS